MMQSMEISSSPSPRSAVVGRTRGGGGGVGARSERGRDRDDGNRGLYSQVNSSNDSNSNSNVNEWPSSSPVNVNDERHCVNRVVNKPSRKQKMWILSIVCVAIALLLMTLFEFGSLDDSLADAVADESSVVIGDDNHDGKTDTGGGETDDTWRPTRSHTDTSESKAITPPNPANPENSGRKPIMPTETTEIKKKNNNSRGGWRSGVWSLVIGTLYFVFQWWSVVSCVSVLADKDVIFDDSAELFRTLSFMASICMWMMWAMTWLAQLNPVLKPMVEQNMHK